MSLALLAAVVVGVLVLTAPRVETIDAAEAAPEATVYRPRVLEVRRPVRGYGEVEAVRAATVSAEVTGLVESVADGVSEGRAVEAGDVLLVLDQRDLAAEASRLRASLDRLSINQRGLREREVLEAEELSIAEEELQRLERIASQDALTQRDVDSARRGVLVAGRALSLTREALAGLPAERAGLAAQLERVTLDLDRTRVRSPLAGRVQSLSVEPGERVVPGQAVARVVDPTAVEVPLRVPASRAEWVTAGDAVVLRPTATGVSSTRGGVEAAGVVDRVVPEVEVTTRTLTVYVRPESGVQPERSNPLLRPGAFVRGDVATGRPERRLLLPRRAVRQGRVQLVVPVQTDEGDGLYRVSSRPVEALFMLEGALPASGLADDQWAALPSDALPEGAAVLVPARSALQDHALVRAVALAVPEADGTATVGSLP